MGGKSFVMKSAVIVRSQRDEIGEFSGREPPETGDGNGVYAAIGFQDLPRQQRNMPQIRRRPILGMLDAADGRPPGTVNDLYGPSQVIRQRAEKLLKARPRQD